MRGMPRIGSRRQPQEEPVPGEGGSLDALSTHLVERLLKTGFDGRMRFDSARAVAKGALDAQNGDAERAVADVVAAHRKLAATSGFLTSVGGLITLPVAIPANVVGFYTLATRMTAAIAAIRGYDINRPELRSAVLLTLIGTDAGDVMAKAGVTTTGGLAGMATRKLPPAALMMVNKAVGFRLVSRMGGRVLARAGKAVPLVGGAVGAGLDVVLLNRIARQAREQFPPVRPLITS